MCQFLSPTHLVTMNWLESHIAVHLVKMRAGLIYTQNDPVSPKVALY